MRGHKVLVQVVAVADVVDPVKETLARQALVVEVTLTALFNYGLIGRLELHLRRLCVAPVKHVAEEVTNTVEYICEHALDRLEYGVRDVVQCICRWVALLIVAVSCILWLCPLGLQEESRCTCASNRTRSETVHCHFECLVCIVVHRGDEIAQCRYQVVGTLRTEDIRNKCGVDT